MHTITLRTRDARLLATGKNRDFPKLSETRAGLRWIGHGDRIAPRLEPLPLTSEPGFDGRKS